MPLIISLPKEDGSDASGYVEDYQFGYSEMRGKRAEQEDALVWQTLDSKELIPNQDDESLNPIEIGHRLWTTYQLLDKPELAAGSTAVTTVYDGKGHLITAILADAAAFVAVYGLEGEVLGVLRLNSVTHKPTEPNENARIIAASGSITNGRVMGFLAVSRAIGDHQHGFKEAGVCSEAKIDITHLHQIAVELKRSKKEIGSYQVISCCDGFTDGASSQSKTGHEAYLFGILKEIENPGKCSEDCLAQHLAEAAIAAGSSDNVSVAVLTIKEDPFLMGVYDGHSGKEASCYIAEHITEVFLDQCSKNRKSYMKQALSVHHRINQYTRDNNDTTVTFMQNELDIDRIANHLLILTNDYLTHVTYHFDRDNPIVELALALISIFDGDQSNKDKIKDYFKLLHAENPRCELKNYEVLQRDTSVNSFNIILFIAVVIITLVTLVIPGLLVMSITEANPLNLIKPNRKKFEEELDSIKERLRFFQAASDSRGVSPTETRRPSVKPLFQPFD